MESTVWVVCRKGEYGAQIPLIAATDAKDALALFDAMQRGSFETLLLLSVPVFPFANDRETQQVKP
jgi:hypothetical protein